jgi:hypothetical protein
VAHQTLIAILIALLSPWASAYVTVLSPTVDCEQLLLQKATKGMRLSLENDPTENPAEVMSREAYSVEALDGIEKVRSAYTEVFRGMKMSPDEIRQTLDDFAKEDASRVNQVPGQNGLDNTVYLVWRDQAGIPFTILRATLIKKGENRKLPVEKHLEIDQGNRVELERAYNAKTPKANIHIRETLMVLADYLKSYFGNNDYTVHIRTERARARDYRRYYGFTFTEHPELGQLEKYHCVISGADFHYRYIGHVEEAKNLAFRSGHSPSNMEAALNLLRDFEQRPGMKDFIPNLVMQSVLLAANGFYSKAVEVSTRLKEIGHADVNEDYFALWNSRALYDPITRRGDASKSLQVLREYLQRHPLQRQDYNDRALLFLVFELKILLASEKWEDARTLLNQNEILLLFGMLKMTKQYQWMWAWAPRQHESHKTRYIELMWDLGTHMDQFSTSVLHVETWDEMARRSPHNIWYQKVAKLMREWAAAPLHRP